MKGKFKEVKSGGRVAQKSAGTKASGRPSEKMGGGSRGEFATQSSNLPGGRPDKRFSNRSGGEYSQVSC